MTTRRSLFGLIAGAAAAAFARPVLASGGVVGPSPLPLVGEVPTEAYWSRPPADFSLTDIDEALHSAWDNYKLNPSVIYFNGTEREYDDLRRQFRRATRRAQMEGLSDVQA